jgi:hypothetical protein
MCILKISLIFKLLNDLNRFLVCIRLKQVIEYIYIYAFHAFHSPINDTLKDIFHSQNQLLFISGIPFDIFLII